MMATHSLLRHFKGPQHQAFPFPVITDPGFNFSHYFAAQGPFPTLEQIAGQIAMRRGAGPDMGVPAYQQGTAAPWEPLA